MENPATPSVTSFVIRFVQEAAPTQPGPSGYRGVIHHVQTNQEISFTRWQDAVQFIERFISLKAQNPENES